MNEEWADRDELTEAMVAAFEDLGRVDAEEIRVQLEALRQLIATGEPVAPASVAWEVRAAPGRVAATLGSFAEAGITFFDEQGRIVSTWGVTVAGAPFAMTRHRLEIDGRVVHPWCALDHFVPTYYLGVSGKVSSLPPGVEEPVTFALSPDGVTELDPAGAVISVLVADRAVMRDVRARFCHYVNFFPSEETAREWASRQEGRYGFVPVEEAHGWIDEYSRPLFAHA